MHASEKEELSSDKWKTVSPFERPIMLLNVVVVEPLVRKYTVRAPLPRITPALILGTGMFKIPPACSYLHYP